MNAPGVLVAGIIRRSFGIRGEVKIESLSGDLETLLSVSELTLRRGDQTCVMAVESSRTAKGHVICKLAGVDDPDQAARLRGFEVIVERSRASTLSEGEYYYADLVGLHVRVDGSRVGSVTGLFEAGTGLLLETTLVDGNKRLVPFDGHFVGDISLDDGTLEILDDEVFR